MLKRLEVVGFKSFAKKMTLDFSSSVTAIVGPNGSGKSNFAESFRFALGEQSMKSMRGKRTEDLIWNGSHTVARQNRASVTVVFDNGQKLFPKIDFDEVAIERVVYRDGSSEYLINGSKVRLRDVQELLATANIGASGHHIISQGEADRILLASPEQRRTMLEDALGLKLYEFKKQEAERKLEKTRENMVQVEALKRELAPHLKFLQKQVEKAERAESLREELSELSRTYFAFEETYIQDERSSIAHTIEKAREAFAVAKSAYDSLIDDTAHSEKSRALANTVSESQSAYDALSRELQSLSRDLGRIEGVIDLQRERERHEQENEIIRVQKSDIQEMHDKAEALYASDQGDVREVLTQFYNSVMAFCRQFIGQHMETKEDVTLVEYERERDELLVRERSLREGLDKAKHEVTRAREALMAYEEAGRAGQQEVLQIADTKAKAERALLEAEHRERELVALKEEFERDRAEVFALVGGSAFSYERPLEKSQESRDVQVERKRKMERLKIRVEEAGGTGEEVKKEYQETKDREEYLAKELADLSQSADGLTQLIADLTNELNTTFSEGLAHINSSFAEFFATMFGGGSAKLTLEVVHRARKMRSNADEYEEGVEEDYESEDENKKPGIEISVNLPRKKVQSLMQLSGGERALTSIALIFAMSQVNPPPFLILDETDAALDEANSRRYGDMIENLAKKSQLVVITHNRETMSRAGVLYGVTMANDGVSKLLTVKFDEAVAVAK